MTSTVPTRTYVGRAALRFTLSPFALAAFAPHAEPARLLKIGVLVEGVLAPYS